MKEYKIITFTCDGNERVIVLHKLTTLRIRFREPDVILYKHYV